MIPVAYLSMSYVGFVRAAHPFLERLSEVTGETVELSVAVPGGADRRRTRCHRPSLQAQSAHRSHLEQPRSSSAFACTWPHMSPAEQREGAQPAPDRCCRPNVTEPRRADQRTGSRRAEGSRDRHRRARPGRLCGVGAGVRARRQSEGRAHHRGARRALRNASEQEARSRPSRLRPPSLAISLSGQRNYRLTPVARGGIVGSRT